MSKYCHSNDGELYYGELSLFPNTFQSQQLILTVKASSITAQE